jgi:hypothetical protein
MAFDWPQFLTQHNISYITTGKVGRNDLGCQCPFCGNADTGYNMSISLIGRGWYCWRQPDGHKGTTPHRLIQALLGCSYLDAEAIVSSDARFIPNDGDFLNRLTALFNTTNPVVQPRLTLKVPEEFRPITNIGMGRMFVSYLEKRGFDYTDIPKLVKDFQLRYCVSDAFLNGAYSNRLIFLITIEHNLVSWTGRHIGSSRLRYNSLSTEDQLLPARLSLKETVLWYDWLHQLDTGTLIVSEGPFDALKLNYLGNPKSIYATCIYGSTISDAQLDLLESLNQFKTKYLLLDAEAGIRYECNFNGWIGPLEARGFQTRILPNTIKDPGELNHQSFSQIFGC